MQEIQTRFLFKQGVQNGNKAYTPVNSCVCLKLVFCCISSTLNICWPEVSQQQSDINCLVTSFVPPSVRNWIVVAHCWPVIFLALNTCWLELLCYQTSSICLLVCTTLLSDQHLMLASLHYSAIRPALTACCSVLLCYQTSTNCLLAWTTLLSDQH